MAATVGLSLKRERAICRSIDSTWGFSWFASIGAGSMLNRESIRTWIKKKLDKWLSKEMAQLQGSGELQRVALKIQATQFSEAGGHLINEDFALVERHPADADCWLCFLADGQGGRAYGAEAAQLACRSAAAAAMKRSPRELCSTKAWEHILKEADSAVFQESLAGFTTLIGLCIRGGQVTGASTGDSAAYASMPTGFLELTAGQLKNPPIGSGSAGVSTFSLGLQEPWVVTLMSDGVWKYVGRSRMHELFSEKNGSELVKALEESARQGSGRKLYDDFTVIVVEGRR